MLLLQQVCEVMSLPILVRCQPLVEAPESCLHVEHWQGGVLSEQPALRLTSHQKNERTLIVRCESPAHVEMRLQRG